MKDPRVERPTCYEGFLHVRFNYFVVTAGGRVCCYFVLRMRYSVLAECTRCHFSSSHCYNFSNWGLLVGHTALYTPISLLMGQIAIGGTQLCTPLSVY